MDNSKYAITIAPNAGLCPGVKKACRKASETTQRPAWILGELAHNPEITRKYKEEHGIPSISSEQLQDVKNGTIILPAHGVTHEHLEQIVIQGLDIVNAICQNVTSIYPKVRSLYEQGYQVVIIGKPNHAEIIGIKDRAGQDAVVITTPEEAEEFVPGKEKIAVLSQTTLRKELVDAISVILKQKAPEVKILDSYCPIVQEMQKTVMKMADENEVIIVIGGKNSENTKQLKIIAENINPNTHWITTAKELKGEWFTGVKTVGITAGASTPDWSIEEIKEKIISEY